MDPELEKAKMVVDALTNVGSTGVLVLFTYAMWSLLRETFLRLLAIVERHSDPDSE